MKGLANIQAATSWKCFILNFSLGTHWNTLPPPASRWRHGPSAAELFVLASQRRNQTSEAFLLARPSSEDWALEVRGQEACFHPDRESLNLIFVGFSCRIRRYPTLLLGPGYLWVGVSRFALTDSLFCRFIYSRSDEIHENPPGGVKPPSVFVFIGF